jgi:hypothetical protein
VLREHEAASSNLAAPTNYTISSLCGNNGVMDGVELAQVGAQIAELGAKLNELRSKRDALNEEIGVLEKELAPLVARHAQLVAEFAGAPPPPQTPDGAPLPQHPAPAGAPASEAVKKRVLQFLRRAPEGVSAREVAEALSLDDSIVREVMREMMRPSGKPLPVEPD